MDLKNKKIGIWGLGVVGKSALQFLQSHTGNLSVMDQKILSAEEETLLSEKKIRFITEHEKTIETFISDHDYIFPSPGIDLRPFKQYYTRFLSELDLFQIYFKKPIIAITGTVGKTTVTHLLTKALQSSGKKIACGGNIGIGMLDLLKQKTEVDCAVIEVSSFQLELTKSFAPDLAIITNLYPNHLDRHDTMHDYINAKMSMVMRQTPPQKALMPIESIEVANKYGIQVPQDVTVCRMTRPVFSLPTLPQNQLLISEACNLLNISFNNLPNLAFDSDIREHRLEHVATINGIEFYNDSKSTISQSTLAAVDQLQKNKIILLLGGINKATDKKTDRQELLKNLPAYVKYIAAFGREAELIKQNCSIACDAFASLESAFYQCLQNASTGDQILLSPGGSSYDLYANYKERGHHFKKLIQELITKNK